MAKRTPSRKGKPGKFQRLKRGPISKKKLASAKPITRQVARSTGGSAPSRPATPARTTPGDPGVRRPTLEPFMTPDQQISDASQRADWDNQLGELDRSLEKLAAETTYQKSQLNKSAIDSKSKADDNMIGRGMFTSSVRDAELYDIEATKTIRSNFLDDQVKLTTLQTQTRKGEIEKHQTAYQNALNKLQTENAAKASEGLNPWIREPTAASTTPGTPAKPGLAPGAPPKGQTYPGVPKPQPRKPAPPKKGKGSLIVTSHRPKRPKGTKVTRGRIG